MRGFSNGETAEFWYKKTGLFHVYIYIHMHMIIDRIKMYRHTKYTYKCIGIDRHIIIYIYIYSTHIHDFWSDIKKVYLIWSGGVETGSFLCIHLSTPHRSDRTESRRSFHESFSTKGLIPSYLEKDLSNILVKRFESFFLRFCHPA